MDEVGSGISIFVLIKFNDLMRWLGEIYSYGRIFVGFEESPIKYNSPTSKSGNNRGNSFTDVQFQRLVRNNIWQVLTTKPAASWTWGIISEDFLQILVCGAVRPYWSRIFLHTLVLFHGMFLSRYTLLKINVKYRRKINRNKVVWSMLWEGIQATRD